ncbi:class I SAM-dependent methyltransferase [Haloarcula amylovorans]|uniref:class I SAM-dependent methyltransferase n=1 Tax=Haloarcula amylovorans TaxID=2562280 RepID=UPI00107688AC|nr:class I SAM-dependent methyltransferase [Halomicroarcula amylolytica]
MSVSDEFDDWAARGKDRGMEDRHWHTAKHVLARMPVEAGDTVLDLGCGSGYAGRALKETKDAGRAYGIDASPSMAENARSYTDDPDVGYLVGDFEHLPFESDSMDHCFSMEAFYYASDPNAVLAEVARVLRSGGTFHCAVNYYEENTYSHAWDDLVDVPMTRWSAAEYRDAFRDAGLSVAVQDNVPDREIEIPAESEFPTEDWDTREAMVERYREFGTLVTVGVAP